MQTKSSELERPGRRLVFNEAFDTICKRLAETIQFTVVDNYNKEVICKAQIMIGNITESQMWLELTKDKKGVGKILISRGYHNFPPKEDNNHSGSKA